MKALVVYESMFGNTAEVATAIAAGLSESVDVDVADVNRAPAEPPPDVALVVAGGPTHAFSMSRVKTRADAISKGARRGVGEVGLREWMEALPSRHPRQKVATFDTRVEMVRRLPGSAARRAAKLARQHGYEAAAPAESFYVFDVEGPLVDGELDRARAWGQKLGASVGQQRA